MPGITLTQAEAQLSTWLDASTKVAAGQQVSVNGKAITRADAKTIQENIVFWDNQVKRLSRSGGIRITGGTPC